MEELSGKDVKLQFPCLKKEQELNELLGYEYSLVIYSSDGRPVEAQIINRAFNKLIKDNNYIKWFYICSYIQG